MSYLQLRKISKRYETAEALRSVSFDVEQGEIIAILGPSGCGKTTLLRCILGLETPDSGSITIGGQKLHTWLRDQRIAYVPQKYANFAYLTVGENVASGVPQQRTPTRRKVVDLLKLVGLAELRDAYPSQLSGGMQQRVALARALAQKAPILAFDESLNSLDAETRYQMQELIHDLWVEQQKTILFVTHDIEEALFLAHRVVVMGTNPGQIREILEVPFPYPRQPKLRFTDEFQRLRRVLSFTIRSEAIKGRLSEETAALSDVIKMGLYYWPGNSPFFYAEDNSMFTEAAIPIELLSFSDNQQKIEYWKHKKLDVLNVTVDTAHRLLKEFPDAEIIAGLNVSHGGDALISREKLTPKQLAGKRIALEKGEVSESFFRYVLYKHKLRLDSMTLVDMPGDEIGSALINGTVDAAVLWEPWLSKAVELAGAHIIASTEQFPVLADVLIARKDFIARNQAAIERLKSVWARAVRALNTDEKEFVQTVAPMVGLSSRELSQQLSRITFLGGGVEEIQIIRKEIAKALITDK